MTRFKIGHIVESKMDLDKIFIDVIVLRDGELYMHKHDEALEQSDLNLEEFLDSMLTHHTRYLKIIGERLNGDGIECLYSAPIHIGYVPKVFVGRVIRD